MGFPISQFSAESQLACGARGARSHCHPLKIPHVRFPEPIFYTGENQYLQELNHHPPFISREKFSLFLNGRQRRSLHEPDVGTRPTGAVETLRHPRVMIVDLIRVLSVLALFGSVLVPRLGGGGEADCIRSLLVGAFE